MAFSSNCQQEGNSHHFHFLIWISPKDAAFTTDKMKQLLKNGIKNSKIPKSDRAAMEIEDVILFTRYSCQALKVKSAQEALDLFLVISSNRNLILTSNLAQSKNLWRLDVLHSSPRRKQLQNGHCHSKMG